MVAPIAPLYHRLLGDVDRRNVEFHDQHHRAMRCNYSITQPWDHLLGTTRWGHKMLPQDRAALGKGHEDERGATPTVDSSS